MAKTVFSGPLLAYGQSPAINGMVSDYNPDLGPSMFNAGVALLDPRRGYFPGGNDTDKVFGWPQTGRYCVIDQVPSQLAANNIAAAQVPTGGTPLTLVSSSAAGITVAQTLVNQSSGAVVTGLLAIDNAPGVVTYGQNASFAAYDPTKAIARNVRITSVGNDSSGNALVRGFDIYGYPMSELITLTNASVASGVKCFKYIQSVTPGGTLSGSNVSVGTGDVYGFPLRVDSFSYVSIWWAGALITASTGFTAAVTTSPATTTTGDVRGKYATQSASNGTNRLTVFVDIPVANLGTVVGLLGVTQA